jgi:hypothetical protein
VESRVSEGVVEVIEEMVLVGEAAESADGSEDFEVFGTGAFEEDSYAASFKFGDDVTERLGASGVEHLELWEAQDHHADIGDAGELGEEPLGGTEEQGAVEAVGDDAFGHEGLFGFGGDFWCAAVRGERIGYGSGGAGHGT